MERCPECYGDVEDMGDYLECWDCGLRFASDSTDDDFEEIEADEYDEEND